MTQYNGHSQFLGPKDTFPMIYFDITDLQCNSPKQITGPKQPGPTVYYKKFIIFKKVKKEKLCLLKSFYEIFLFNHY